LMACARVSFTF